MATVYYLLFPNGKGYVGQTRADPKQRLRMHRWAAKNKPNDARILYRAWRKYGEPQMLIIADVSPEQLSTVERNCIALLNTQKPSGYNITEGGETAAMTEETRMLISQHRMGMRFSDSHKAALKAARAGQVISEANKQKHSETCRVSFNTPEFRAMRSRQTKASWAARKAKAGQVDLEKTTAPGART